MLAIKKARKLIQTSPESPGSKTLAALVIALESDQAFPLRQLHSLSYSPFELALETLGEWRPFVMWCPDTFYPSGPAVCQEFAHSK